MVRERDVKDTRLDGNMLYCQGEELGKLIIQLAPELEIFEAGFFNTARYLEKKGIFKAPLHFNLIMGSLGSIPSDIRDMVYPVESLPPGSTWAAAGIGRFQNQVAAAAILTGGHVRIGPEDSIYRDYRERILTKNQELVGQAIEIARGLEREIASPRVAREIHSLGNPHSAGVPEKFCYKENT